MNTILTTAGGCWNAAAPDEVKDLGYVGDHSRERALTTGLSIIFIWIICTYMYAYDSSKYY